MTTKQKKQPTKQKTRAPQGASQAKGGLKSLRPAREAKVPREHLNTVVGIINPFSAAARGIKYPDESSTKTLPYQRHERLTVNSDATGFGGLIVLPSYFYNMLIGATAATATTLTAPTTVAAATSKISCDNYRIVSWGLRISNVTAPLSSSGTIAIRGWSAADSGALSVINATSYNSSFSEDIPLQDVRDVLILGQLSDMSGQAFVDTQSDYGAAEAATATFVNWVRKGFNPITIHMAGVPANTPCLAVELIVNYELGFFDHDGVGILATTAPEFHPHVHNAHKNIRSKMKNVFKKGSEQLAKHAVEAAATALANYIAPGGRSSLAAIVD